MNLKNFFLNSIPNLAKGIAVYLCSVILATTVVGLAMISFAPSIGLWIYAVSIPCGIGLGFVLNKRITGLPGVFFLVVLSIFALMAGDQLIHSMLQKT